MPIDRKRRFSRALSRAARLVRAPLACAPSKIHLRPSLRLLAAALLLAAMGAIACTGIKLLNPEERRAKAIDMWNDGLENYEKKGDYTRAIEIYQDALSLSPRQMIYYHLGHCYMMTGDMDRAEEYLSRAIEMQPDYEMARIDLRRVLDLKERQTGEAPTPVIKAPTRTSFTYQPGAEPGRDPKFLIDDGTFRPAAVKGGEAPEPLAENPKAQLAEGDNGYGHTVSPQPILERVTPRPADGEAPPVQVAEAQTQPPEEPDTPRRPAATPTPQPTPTPPPPPTPTPKPTPLPEVTPMPPRQPIEIAEAQATAQPAEPTPQPRPEWKPPAPAATPRPVRTPEPTPEPTPPPSDDEVQGALFPEGTPAPAPRPDGVRTPKSPGAPPVAQSEIVLGTFPYHFKQARRLMKVGEYERAGEEFQKALRLDPKHLDARLGYGDCLARRGRFHKAHEQFLQAAEQHPREPKIYLRIGNLYLNSKQEGSAMDARRAFTRAVAVDPNYKYAHNNLGILAMQSGEVETAIEHFQKVLDIDTDYETAHLNLGILYHDYQRNENLAYYHYRRYIDLGGKRADEVKKWLRDLEAE